MASTPTSAPALNFELDWTNEPVDFIPTGSDSVLEQCPTVSFSFNPCVHFAPVEDRADAHFVACSGPVLISLNRLVFFRVIRLIDGVPPGTPYLQAMIPDFSPEADVLKRGKPVPLRLCRESRRRWTVVVPVPSLTTENTILGSSVIDTTPQEMLPLRCTLYRTDSQIRMWTPVGCSLSEDNPHFLLHMIVVHSDGNFGPRDGGFPPLSELAGVNAVLARSAWPKVKVDPCLALVSSLFGDNVVYRLHGFPFLAADVDTADEGPDPESLIPEPLAQQQTAETPSQELCVPYNAARILVCCRSGEVAFSLARMAIRNRARGRSPDSVRVSHRGAVTIHRQPGFVPNTDPDSPPSETEMRGYLAASRLQAQREAPRVDSVTYQLKIDVYIPRQTNYAMGPWGGEDSNAFGLSLNDQGALLTREDCNVDADRDVVSFRFCLPIADDEPLIHLQTPGPREGQFDLATTGSSPIQLVPTTAVLNVMLSQDNALLDRAGWRQRRPRGRPRQVQEETEAPQLTGPPRLVSGSAEELAVRKAPEADQYRESCAGIDPDTCPLLTLPPTMCSAVQFSVRRLGIDSMAVRPSVKQRRKSRKHLTAVRAMQQLSQMSAAFRAGQPRPSQHEPEPERRFTPHHPTPAPGVNLSTTVRLGTSLGYGGAFTPVQTALTTSSLPDVDASLLGHGAFVPAELVVAPSVAALCKTQLAMPEAQYTLAVRRIGDQRVGEPAAAAPPIQLSSRVPDCNPPYGQLLPPSLSYQHTLRIDTGDRLKQRQDAFSTMNATARDAEARLSELDAQFAQDGAVGTMVPRALQTWQSENGTRELEVEAAATAQHQFTAPRMSAALMSSDSAMGLNAILFERRRVSLSERRIMALRQNGYDY